jgi:hypothetical protein
MVVCGGSLSFGAEGRIRALEPQALALGAGGDAGEPAVELRMRRGLGAVEQS